MSEDTSSNDIALLCHSPQIIAEAYRRASNSSGDARDKLSWKLGFVEVVARFLVAVLSAEHHRLGLKENKDFKKLINNLQVSSWGMWLYAAKGLAADLLDSRKKHVAKGLANLIVEKKKGKGIVATKLFLNLESLKKIRDIEIGHPDATASVSEPKARELLKKFENVFQEINYECRAFKDYSVFVVKDQGPLGSGEWQNDLLQFSGVQPNAVDSIVSKFPIAVSKNVPFLVNSDGHILMLAPLIHITPGYDGFDEMRLISRYDEKKETLLFSHARGGPLEALSKTLDSLYLARSREDLTRALIAKKDVKVDKKTAVQLIDLYKRQRVVEIEGYLVKPGSLLGYGGSGHVYLGQPKLKNQPPGELVAIKRLDPNVLRDTNQRERLKREYEVLKQVAHKNVVTVFEYKETLDVCLVMEYIPGQNLRSYVQDKRDRKLNLDQAVRIIREVLEALIAVHSRRITHRDIKPSNIMYSKGVVKLIDFGIASQQDMRGLTRIGDNLGTHNFSDPQQRSGAHDVRFDLYSIGKTLEFLLTGELPEPGQLPKGIDLAVKPMIAKVTDPNLDLRYKSALEMRDAIVERSENNWGGAPVRKGDVLIGGNYVLGNLYEKTERSWIFEAYERASGNQVYMSIPFPKLVSEFKEASKLRRHEESAPLPIRLQNSQEIDSDVLIIEHKNPGSIETIFIFGSSINDLEQEAAYDELYAKTRPAPYLQGIGSALFHAGSGDLLAIRSWMVLVSQIIAVQRYVLGEISKKEVFQSFLGGFGHLPDPMRPDFEGISKDVARIEKGTASWSSSNEAYLDAVKQAWEFSIHLGTEISPERLKPFVVAYQGSDKSDRWAIVRSVAGNHVTFVDLWGEGSVESIGVDFEALARFGFEVKGQVEVRSLLRLEFKQNLSEWFPELDIVREDQATLEVGFESVVGFEVQFFEGFDSDFSYHPRTFGGTRLRLVINNAGYFWYKENSAANSSDEYIRANAPEWLAIDPHDVPGLIVESLQKASLFQLPIRRTYPDLILTDPPTHIEIKNIKRRKIL